MTVTDTGPRELDELSKSGRPIDLIGVRTPTEYREVPVGFARNVPLDRLDPAAGMRDRVGPAGDPLYVVCRCGGRGAQACDRFAKAGFPNAVNVAGGTTACVEAGLPVVRGPKATSRRLAAGRRAPPSSACPASRRHPPGPPRRPCASPGGRAGQRGYLATRILLQAGFAAANVGGGYKTYRLFRPAG